MIVEGRAGVDAELIVDALVAQAAELSTVEPVRMSVSVQPRDLELRVGPLENGRAERLVASSAVDGVGPVIEKLADERRLLADGDAEVLSLRLRDER